MEKKTLRCMWSRWLCRCSYNSLEEMNLDDCSKIKYFPLNFDRIVSNIMSLNTLVRNTNIRRPKLHMRNQWVDFDETKFCSWEYAWRMNFSVLFLTAVKLPYRYTMDAPMAPLIWNVIVCLLSYPSLRTQHRRYRSNSAGGVFLSNSFIFFNFNFLNK